ncbi:MAG: single-stranded DNA-binding protein [Planctomycetes bacterium]|nr:single-stranded DNA-binding protein [Planctomycetota bacterium]
MRLQKISDELSDQVDALEFRPPVTWVYNPLSYARALHHAYLDLAQPNADALLLGMNPGPWGMAQTGVPFGEVAAVRNWLKIRGQVIAPLEQHQKRPILGLDCSRSEVSGRRLWAWAEQRYRTPKKFFKQFFVYNFCPLAFLEETGRNRTPDKLPIEEKQLLFDVCDEALRRFVTELKPKRVIGIGRFAEQRAKIALAGMNVPTATILHPSPASPAANRGWQPQIEKQLAELGLPCPTN